jgi:hypothetical protein
MPSTGKDGSVVKPLSALRNVLVRKSLRVFSIGAMAIAVSGLVLAAAPSAGATTYGPFYLQETYSSYRVGAPNVSAYDPVQETLGGREIYLGTTGTAYHYKIPFLRDTSLCVAAANNEDTVDLKPCSGANGVVWIAITGQDGCSAVLESQEFSGKYLSGTANGSQFHIRSYQAKGWYQQFRLVDPQTGNETCF